MKPDSPKQSTKWPLFSLIKDKTVRKGERENKKPQFSSTGNVCKHIIFDLTEIKHDYKGTLQIIIGSLLYH